MINHALKQSDHTNAVLKTEVTASWLITFFFQSINIFLQYLSSQSWVWRPFPHHPSLLFPACDVVLAQAEASMQDPTAATEQCPHHPASPYG